MNLPFLSQVRISVIVLVITLSFAWSGGPPAKAQDSFVVIDSIHYNDKGDLSALKMKDYTVFYNVHIWPKDVRATNKTPPAPPSEEQLAGLVKDLTNTRMPVLYDIEHWPLDIRSSVPNVADDDIASAGKKVVTESMSKMIQIITLSRKINPGLQYGYYGCVPLRDYWASTKKDPELIRKWQEANDFLKPLADTLDVLCPSIYAFYSDREAWVVYARANIEEAKRLAKGKPVYAYLWPKYHNSNKSDGKKFIEGDFWRLQLETIRASGIAGVIIWDSRLVVNNPEDSVWDPSRPWWKETVAFLERLNK